MPNTLRLANGFARSDFRKTPVKAHPCAGGFIRERSWMEAATTHQLFRDLEIRVVTAPGLGRGDFLASHDLEDLIFVIDGRSTIVEEVQTEAPLLREYLHREFARLLAAPGFIDALPGYLLPDAASQARIRTVLRRLRAVGSSPATGIF